MRAGDSLPVRAAALLATSKLLPHLYLDRRFLHGVINLLPNRVVEPAKRLSSDGFTRWKR
jgi:hypothetical protein